LNIKLYNYDMSSKNEELVKITSSSTISIPKQFRMFLEIQKGKSCQSNFRKRIARYSKDYNIIDYTFFGKIMPLLYIIRVNCNINNIQGLM